MLLSEKDLAHESKVFRCPDSAPTRAENFCTVDTTLGSRLQSVRKFALSFLRGESNPLSVHN